MEKESGRVVITLPYQSAGNPFVLLPAKSMQLYWITMHKQVLCFNPCLFSGSVSASLAVVFHLGHRI